MSARVLPFELEGETARLVPAPRRSLARGPGQLGREGAAGLAVWDAGGGIWERDLFAAFWDFDAGRIDWLSGFLCDQETTEWFEALANPPEAEEAPEEMFARASMNTLESSIEDR